MCPHQRTLACIAFNEKHHIKSEANQVVLVWSRSSMDEGNKANQSMEMGVRGTGTRVNGRPRMRWMDKSAMIEQDSGIWRGMVQNPDLAFWLDKAE